jgi:hypothetical protein
MCITVPYSARYVLSSYRADAPCAPQWANPSASLDPENFKVKELLRALGADPGVSLDFVLDLHAHSTAMNACGPPLPTPAPARGAFPHL